MCFGHPARSQKRRMKCATNVAMCVCVRALAHSRLLIYYLQAKHFSKKKKRRNKFKSHFNNRVIRTRSGTRICAGERACARDPATLCMIFIFYIILLIGVVFGFDYSFGFFLLCLFFALGPSLGCRWLIRSFVRLLLTYKLNFQNCTNRSHI